MNGNCYSTDGVNPTLTTNKGEGTKIAFPINAQCDEITTSFVQDINRNARHQQDLIQSPYEVSRTIPAGTHASTPHLLKTAFVVGSGEPINTEADGTCKTIKASTGRITGENYIQSGSYGVTGVAVTVTGFNATANEGGYDPNVTCTASEGLQRSVREQTNDDSSVFAIDKGIRPRERDLANCIEAREDRGLSKRNQEGTLICLKI